MLVVSDSSPLILYAKSGLLGLLHAVFGEVWTSPAVHDEVTIAGRAGAEDIRSATWVVRTEIPEALVPARFCRASVPANAEWLDRQAAEALLAAQPDANINPD